MNAPAPQEPLWIDLIASAGGKRSTRLCLPLPLRDDVILERSTKLSPYQHLLMVIFLSHSYQYNGALLRTDDDDAAGLCRGKSSLRM